MSFPVVRHVRAVWGPFVGGALAVGMLAMVGCGRGSMVGRSVDDFSAYYNKFYNARQTFTEATRPLDELDQPVDQDTYLPVFVEPTQVDNEKAFGKTIEKSADLLRRHPRSKWVDDALLLIGKAYFYEENYVGAERKFREVIGHGGPLTGEARFWLGRVLLSSGDFTAAEQHLKESLQQEGLAKQWAAHMQLLLGDLHVRRESWPEAAERLAAGLRNMRDGQVRARAFFLRAQVLETMGRYTDAARSYRAAVEERPRYELTYAAEASALRMAARVGQNGLFRELRRLKHDDKNESKQAELALLRARLHKLRGEPDRARRYYRALLYPGKRRRETAMPSSAVRGRAHYALAMLYRNVYRDFTRAAAHFDTAATALPSLSSAESGGRPALPTAYAITDSRRLAERYGRVAEAARAVARLDSLLRLGRMEEAAFRTFVDSLRRARAEARRTARVQEARRRAERGFQQRGVVEEQRGGRASTVTGESTATGGEAGFLFHRDPARVQEGFRGFVRRWGERPRVPNWRRQAAISARAADERPDAPPGEREQVALPATGLPSVDVSAVPRSPAELSEARAKRAALRYDLGNALLLAAERPDSAAVWFRSVVEEGADTSVVRRARYALAEAERAAGRVAEARAQYRRVVREYPGTKLARRAEQRLAEEGAAPTALSEKEQAEEAYARAYRQWEKGAHEEARRRMLETAASYPESSAAPRALLAAAHIFAEERRRTGRPMTASFPGPLPDSLHLVLGDSLLRREGMLRRDSLSWRDSSVQVIDSLAQPVDSLGPPSDTTTVVGFAAADTAAARDSLQDASPPTALTLERLLAGLVRSYPQTPFADRARRMLRALRGRHPQRLATRAAGSRGAEKGEGTPSRPDSTDAHAVSADSSVQGRSRGHPSSASRTTDERPDVRRRLNVDGAQNDSTARDTSSTPLANSVLVNDEGSWTIVVASAQDQSQAEVRADRFRRRLGDEAVWVIPPASRSRQQYHIGVGRFASRIQGEAALRQYRSTLPPDSQLSKMLLPQE